MYIRLVETCGLVLSLKHPYLSKHYPPDASHLNIYRDDSVHKE